LDTATPAGELVATALAMAARFEWYRISERQREKFHELRRVPVVPVAVLPFPERWQIG
jgi:DNA invertase Pin-like site-specific DNA recombinase